ncbi:MAG: cytochrome c oxidase subunit 3 family protein [Pseudobdellovibrionaceae bacterium]|nr:cytochrome c oxidase subunit 3 family protein [Bdellovibrionales bacterium]USN46633.1 MAG: cytochrome c oxidase subunit 3 family protein [Pseudobdellovibrionaceae bacterium]
MSTVNTTHHPAHHFRDAEHEFNTSKFGVWLFLCTEILMFGGLFVAYAIYHNMYPELFQAGAQFLDWRFGALNTVVLLMSSFTMALGIYYSQKNNSKMASLMLTITLICGAIFMGVKYIEYSHKIHEGLLPGKLYSYQPGPETHLVHELPKNIPMYFSFYFVMTGIHGLHVLIGMGLILWVLLRARKNEFNENYYTPVEGVGLFWHLVDLIWIYLFPLLYLVG